MIMHLYPPPEDMRFACYQRVVNEQTELYTEPVHFLAVDEEDVPTLLRVRLSSPVVAATFVDALEFPLDFLCLGSTPEDAITRGQGMLGLPVQL